MRAFLRRLRARIKYRHFERDLSREIDTHRAIAEEHARASHAADPCSTAAKLLGNTTLAKEDARAVWVSRWLETVLQDMRYGARMLWRNPAFAAAALGALVLGVSLNVSLFTVFNAVVLRPWIVPDTDRVVLAQATRTETSTSGVSPVEGRYLQGRLKGLDAFMFAERRVQIGDNDSLRGSSARLISTNYFPTLRLQLQLGSGFLPSDDTPGAARAVFVMGAATWRSTYSADPNIVGTLVKLNDVPFTVVGVAADDARDSTLSPLPQAWLPIAAAPLLEPNSSFARELPINPTSCCVKLAGRLRPGVTMDAASAELSALDQQYQHDAGIKPDGRIRLTSTRMLDQPQAARFVPVFGMMFVGTLLLLVLACANVGNLLLARAMSRQREIGVRLALGADRTRVIRQLLTEGFVLAGLSMLITLPIAKTLPGLVLMAVVDNPAEEVLDLSLDPRVLSFALIIAVVSCVLFSLAPALRTTRAVASSVRNGRSSGAARLPLRTALLAVQVAISAVLLVSAGLLARGLLHAASANLGFTPSGVASIAIELPKNTYSDDAANAFGDELSRRLTAANIGSVAFTSIPPLGQMNATSRLQLPGMAENQTVRVEVHSVSPSYFDVLHIRMVSGRTFANREPGAVVINRSFERLLAGSGSALGKPMVPSKTPRIVVGVVDDAKLTGLGDTPPAYFQPAVGFSGYVVVADNAQSIAKTEAMVASLEPRATVAIAHVSDGIKTELRGNSVGAGVAGALGIAAILLAAIGIFGVFSYVVNERSQEIGLRLALGAQSGDIVRTVLGGAAVGIGAGLGVGVVLSLISGSLLSSNLFGVSPRDPVAFASAIGVLTLAAAVAVAVPVLRALRVDPAITLRQD